MSMATPDPGSFRDPSGRIYYVDDRVFRTVTEHAAAEFEFVRDTGLIERLVSEGQLIKSDVVSADVLGETGVNSRYVIEHPRLPFISYPYEWSFQALKAAALLHLNVHLVALDTGVTLSDASAYNVQFLGPRPVFIDLLSFRKYKDGEMWMGHRQFCEQFLNPLLLRSKLGVVHNSWYRGAQEGISTSDLRRLLPWTSKLSLNVLFHVVAQSAFEGSQESIGKKKKVLATAQFSIDSYRRILLKLRDWIQTLEPADSSKTIWKDYAKTHSYNSDEASEKKAFIAKFSNTVKPGILWDLGCNTGDYSDVALDNGAAYSVGFDFDHGALELAFSRASEECLSFLPLFLDAANPSPNQGWRQNERKGLNGRANADAIVALAFIHHIAIGRNVPIDDVTCWLTSLAPQGIIEFVPKQDPMIQKMLALREDIFHEYTEENLLLCLSKSSEIIETQTVTATGRKLIWFRRR
jgi:ribosomal protein L11 methylase PrmA